MQYIPCNSALLAQEALFLPKKALFMPKDLQKKVRKSRQILTRDKIAYVRASNFRPSPNFSAGATRALVQLLPPWTTRARRLCTNRTELIPRSGQMAASGAELIMTSLRKKQIYLKTTLELVLGRIGVRWHWNGGNWIFERAAGSRSRVHPDLH